MTEQAGHLNAPDLVEECAAAFLGRERYQSLPESATYQQRKSAGEQEWVDKYEVREDIKIILSVLRKRGLLTIQALELLADK